MKKTTEQAIWSLDDSRPGAEFLRLGAFQVVVRDSNFVNKRSRKKSWYWVIQPGLVGLVEKDDKYYRTKEEAKEAGEKGALEIFSLALDRITEALARRTRNRLARRP